MRMRFGLIVNPRSHRVRTRGSVLERVASSRRETALVRIDDFSTLPERLSELHASGAAWIFIEGGDGTLQAVLSGWPELAGNGHVSPGFAILPGGSTNLAWAVAGLRRTGVQDILDYIDRLEETGASEVETLHCLRVTSDGFDRPEIGFLLSTGALASAMRYTQQSVFSDGRRGSPALVQAILRFLSAPYSLKDQSGAHLLAPSDLAASSACFNFRGAHALSLATTLPRLSLGLQPYWSQARGPIAFTHAAWPVAGLRRAFLRILLRQAGPGMIRHGLTSYRTQDITLTYDGPVMLDGELLPVRSTYPVRIGSTPPIRFIR